MHGSPCGSNPGQSPTVIFLHVPKAAGTTLHKILDRQYPRKTVYRFDMQLPGAWERLQARCADRDAPLRCLKGHQPYGLHRLLAGPATYLTVLRDPVQRVISKYRYLKQRPGLPERLGFRAGQLACLDAFIDAQVAREAMDFQTRLLGGFLDPAHPQAPYPPLPPDALAQAQRHLEADFPVVGLVERFDATVLLLRRAFGWRHVWVVPRNATGASRPRARIAADTLRRLAHVNARDVALYAFAQARFERQIQEYGPSFDTDLQRLHRSSRLHAWFRGLLDRARGQAGQPPEAST